MSPIFSPKDHKGLLVISCGGGQDSTVLNYKMILDKDYRERILGGRKLVIVFSDTGNEHKETYKHVEYLKKLNSSYGIEFIHLTPDLGYHSDPWATLTTQWERNNTIAMKRNKSCTDNLKIKPIYRWLDHYCSILLGKESRNHFNKNHIREFSAKYGKIEMQIGFAVGEESRMKKSEKHGKEGWWKSISKTFPLITDLKMKREDCISYMEESGFRSCPPSNCIMCPNVSKQELIYLWRFERGEFIKWVRYERKKLKNNMHKGDKNVGALGNKGTLIDELRKAINKFGHWTNEEIRDYKFSHGHCINNGY